MKGISRIDSGSTHGWFVRGYRNRVTSSKLFSDRKCGGKNKARAAAKEYRDGLHASLAKIPKERRGPRIVLEDSRNKTGELGVSRVTRIGASGQEYPIYTATWRPELGVQKCTSFSVNKYGEKGAFRKAVALRRAKMKEIHGPDFYKDLAKLKKKRLASKA